MGNFARASHVAKIEAVKAKLRTASGIHKKDLSRQLKKLQKDLIVYDKYISQAVMNSG